MDRAKAAHPGLHSDELIPFAAEENIWQAIENLFFASPATRTLVQEGKVKVLGAMYDVATGKIRWMNDAKVVEILKRVEANPNRSIEPMAGEGHESGFLSGPHAAEKGRWPINYRVILIVFHC